MPDEIVKIVEAEGSPVEAARPQAEAGKPRGRLKMTTAVWGDWFIGALLDLNLPTLLAPENLPALARRCEITYVIFTRAADFERLDLAPEIAALREFIEVEIRLLADAELADPIATHHRCWKRITEEAIDENSFVLLLPPDVAWSENALESVARRLDRGERAVFMTYLRAESETFISAMKARRDPSRIDLALPPTELVEMCVRSLHPLMAAYLRQSDYFPYHMEMMLWAVPQEGFLARIFAREMFLYNPGELKLNQAALSSEPFAPGEASFLSDSDELFAVSLAPLGKDIQWHLAPRQADPVDLAHWWLNYDSPSNDFLVSHKLRWHFTPVTEKKWRAIELGSDLFVRRCAGAREGMRLWRAARELGCFNAALLLATAAHTGASARAMRGRGPAIAFVPTEGAFARQPPGTLEKLLDPANQAQLVRLLRAHHIPDCGLSVSDPDPLGTCLGERSSAQIATGCGTAMLRRLDRGGYLLDGMRIRPGVIAAGLNKVYAIDGLRTAAVSKAAR